MWLVGIDKRNFPDAVLDRCITIRLKKRITSEPVEPFDLYTTPQEAKPIRDRLAAWSDSVSGKLRERGRPDVPEGIEARFRNKWEPLFAMADEVDGTGDTPGTGDTGEPWGSRVRRAALEYLKDEGSEESLDQGQLLLSHIRQVLGDTATEDDKISSSDLVTELQRIEDAPWSRYRGSYPLSQNDLSILLRPYDIHPKARSFGERRLRGYRTGDFEDAFK
jgi:Protein of unknown function (DUF3631)